VEHLLNLVWVCAIVAIVFAVRARQHRDPDSHAQYANAIVLLCIGLLLFPVISASDDLHSAYVLGDDPSWRHDKRSLATQPVAPVLISLSGLLSCGANQLADVSLITTAAQPGHLRLDEGRAPPVTF
jgi:hypothetical protein